MILVGVAGAANGAIMRHIGEAYSAPQRAFLFCAGGLLWMLPWLLRHGIPQIKTSRIRLYVLRSVLEMAGWTLVFTAVLYLQYPVFSALSFTTPMLLATAAVFFLGERPTRHVWIALFMGMVGILVVTRPGMGEVATMPDLLGVCLVLSGAVCFAVCGFLIKKLLITEPPSVVAFYMAALTALIALPFAAIYWKPLQIKDMMWFVMTGALFYVQQFSVARAFSYAPLTTVLPFSFLNLIVSSAIAYVAFDEIVDMWTLIGGGIILYSAVYAFRHRQKQSVPEVEDAERHHV